MYHKKILDISLINWLLLFLKCLKLFDYTNRVITVSDLPSGLGRGLFKQVCSSNRCSYHLLPPTRSCNDLRAVEASSVLSF